MQANLYQRRSNLVALSKKTIIGDVIQVRNHVKIYPWRKNRNSRECYLDNTKTPYTDRYNINEFNVGGRQKKPWQYVIPKDKDNRFNSYKWNENYRSDPIEARETAASKLSRFRDSLMSRGSARESKPYNPPHQVQDRVLALYRMSSSDNAGLSDEDILDINLNQSMEFKFTLISKCIEAFNHDLPSSWLNDTESVRDLVDYFSTPVRGINPYAALINEQTTLATDFDDPSPALPFNLSLLPEPARFDKETDVFFKGYNALPGIVSKVPGLRARKKFPILNQDEFQWPDI